MDPRARHAEPLAAAQVSSVIADMQASLARRKATCEVATAATAGRAAATWMADMGVVRAVLADDPVVDQIGLDAALRAAGIDVLRWPVPLSRREILGLEGPEDVCGITVPTLAVAERGTLVLEASEGHGRGLDVTNRHHLALLPADRIVETLGQALAQTYAPGRPIPSAVSLVSGPSRSSDIEKISTLGAHGALTEHVMIISG